jgi:heavy metal sensor kinase
MFHSVRTRLTLWYAGVLALSLVVFAFLVYYASARTFYEQQDESLHSTAQTVVSAYLEELAEVHSAAQANQVVLAEIAFPDRYVEVVDPAGNVVAWSSNLNGRALSVPPQTCLEARAKGLSYVSLNNLRVAVVPLSTTQELGFAAVAEPLSVIDEGLRRLRRDFFAGVPIILLLASAGGYFLARKSLSPIALMNRQTRRITAENLSSRLDVMKARDEVGSLATTINDLLARLEFSFNEQQRFVADASHELRTPLAILRGETEVALERDRRPDEYQQSLTLIRDEAERLTRIVEDLFLLARRPVDAPVVRTERLSLNQMVDECVRAARVLAARKNLRLNTDARETVTLSGDDELLKRMLLNLLDNAVKYTPEGGAISVELTVPNGNARIVVRDSGMGITEAEQARVFDRFYRVDKARSRALGGAGLGLSIAEWIVKAHGGTILVESSPGKGSAFVVDLPLTDPNAA